MKIKMNFPQGFFGGGSHDDALSTAMRLIAISFDPGGDGWSWPSKYGICFENDVFAMRPDYQDAECTCGFNNMAEQWHQEHPCQSSCYSVARQQNIDEWKQEHDYDNIDKRGNPDIFDVNGKSYHSYEEAKAALSENGGHMSSRRSAQSEKAFRQWKKLYIQLENFEESLSRRLCGKFRIPWNKGYGSAVHCTCGKDEQAEVFFKNKNHEFRCHVEFPQFWFKLSDTRVQWYKYIGRDMSVIGGELPGNFLDTIFLLAPLTLEQACQKLEQEQDEHQKQWAAMMKNLQVSP